MSKSRNDFGWCDTCNDFCDLAGHVCSPVWLCAVIESVPVGDFSVGDDHRKIRARDGEDAAILCMGLVWEGNDDVETFAVIREAHVLGGVWPDGRYTCYRVSVELIPSFSSVEVG